MTLSRLVQTIRAILPALLLVLPLLFNALTIGSYSYWLDEIYTVTAAAMPFQQMIGIWFQDVHPPFHTVLIHFWLQIAGDGELVNRLPSTLAVALGCWTVWRLISPWPRPVQIVVAALIGSNFMLAIYGQDVRAYGFVFLGSALTSYAFVHRDRMALWHMLLIALYCGLVHYFTLLYAGLLLALLAFERIRQPGALIAICLTGGLMLAWPVAQVLIGPIQNLSGGNFWIPPKTVGEVLLDLITGTMASGIYGWIILQKLPPLLVAGGSVIALLIIAVLVWLRRNSLPPLSRSPALLFGALTLAVLVIAYIVGQNTPIITPRNLLVLALPLAITIGWTFYYLIAGRWHLPLIGGFVALVLLGNLNFTYARVTERIAPAENWRAAGAFAATLNQDQGYDLYALDYFNKHEGWLEQVYRFYVDKHGGSTPPVALISRAEIADLPRPFALFLVFATCEELTDIQAEIAALNIPFTLYEPPQSNKCFTSILYTDPS